MIQAPASVRHSQPGIVPRKGASALAIGMAVFGLFAVATGCADVVLGPHLLIANGATLGASVNEPWLDSQLRFLGAMWAGWGVLMVWACRNLNDRGDAFDLLAAVLFLGGCGRVASCLIHPGSPALLIFFAGLEILVAVAAFLLRRAVIRVEHRPRGS